MKLALFDFDGTLTTKDSFIEFIIYSKGRTNFLFGFLLLSPVLISYKIGLIKNWKAKEIVLSFFFKKLDYNLFKTYCQKFANEKIDRIINPTALNRMLDRKRESYRIIIVSASVEDWIRPWSEKLDVELIGTKLAIDNNKLTGKISGNNCYGIEKVYRIKEIVDLSAYSKIEVYGDSSGDYEMMKLATDKFYKEF